MDVSLSLSYYGEKRLSPHGDNRHVVNVFWRTELENNSYELEQRQRSGAPLGAPPAVT